MRILFATPEFEDFIRVGGLASVSSALSRTLSSKYDVRVVLPGFPAVLKGVKRLAPVAKCDRLGDMPACTVLRGQMADGLKLYVVRCPELYERPGTPYADSHGVDWPDNDVRFARFASAAA